MLFYSKYDIISLIFERAETMLTQNEIEVLDDYLARIIWGSTWNNKWLESDLKNHFKRMEEEKAKASFLYMGKQLAIYTKANPKNFSYSKLVASLSTLLLVITAATGIPAIIIAGLSNLAVQGVVTGKEIYDDNKASKEKS